MPRGPRPGAENTPQKSTSSREPRWLVQAARFGHALKQRGLSPPDFARQSGLKYVWVNRWIRGFDFPPARQAQAAEALGLPLDAFDPASEELRATAARRETVARREAEAARVLEAFTERCPIAKALTPSDWRVLRSIKFLDADLRPSVAFFEAVAYALRGAIRVDEILSVAEENAELDDSLSRKPPLTRR